MQVHTVLQQCNHIISTLCPLTFFDVVKNPHVAQALMIRSELTSLQPYKHPQLTNSGVEVAVKTISDCIIKQLAQGNRVELRGWQFQRAYQASKIGTQPQHRWKC